MQLERHDRASDFLAAVGDWLTEREAEHNLILGIAGTVVRDGPPPADEVPLFVAVRDGGRPLLAAVRTPPWNLLLSEVDDPAALDALADGLAAEPIPGATGPPAAVERFAGRWSADHGVRSEIVLNERIYRLEAVMMPAPVEGAPRRASTADRPLLADLLVAFHEEALPAEGGDRARRMIAEWDPDTGRQFWLWEVDGEPVSLVGAGSPTPNGIRIGPVYTPPAARGRGYASRLTAVVSQAALDDGRRFCFLYTDLANPTANRIYQAIGYRPVTDARMVRFTGA